MKRRIRKNVPPLKRIRQLFEPNINDTDLSESSTESEEYCHIPLKSGIPSLSNRFLGKNKKMDQLTVQMQEISRQLANLTTKQAQYDEKLNSLQQELPIPDFSDIESEAGAANLPGPTNSANLMESLSKIPDPIKSIPSFDGNVKQLNAWILSTEQTLKIFKPLVPTNVFSIYEQCVINKLQGKAKDVICMAQYPLTFAEAKQILLNRLGERQDLSAYKAKLWRNRQGESMSVHKYYQRTQYLVETIKSLAKQDSDYAKHWPVICKFIDQDALAAFVSGLNEFYFGHALSARPKTLEDAYAFLCEFTSSERIARGEKKNDNNNSRQKFGNSKPNPNFSKQKQPQIQHNHSQNPKNIKPNDVEPMEIGSVRSRLTLNRNMNNNEVEREESDEEYESEQEQDFYTSSQNNSPE